MRLITYRRDATTGPALLKDGHVFPLNPLGYSDTQSFIAAGPKRWTAVNVQLEETGLNLLAPLSAVTLDAPVLRPGKILCIGLNYRDHAAESKMDPPKFPTVFCKFPHVLVGDGQPILLPRATQQPDYEAEFAVVIGKTGRNIPESDWEEYVFGYTIMNDVSARDVQLATSQWTLGKNFPTFGPMGPWIVSKDEVADPHNLDISLAINGETLQSSNTRELIFKLPKLISYISTMMPLAPGDIISTGTPAGVGMGRNPQRWLRPGDDVVIQIAGIGALRNPVQAEP
ncbi:MAG TPA: fumarylacetoacetate hydrolase family protein [Acidobacteriaceae bacterium]|nr:fumarylacetoacetate hydrolase family protein [Acidobacteriaceae bacterium]